MLSCSKLSCPATLEMRLHFGAPGCVHCKNAKNLGAADSHLPIYICMLQGGPNHSAERKCGHLASVDPLTRGGGAPAGMAVWAITEAHPLWLRGTSGILRKITRFTIGQCRASIARRPRPWDKQNVHLLYLAGGNA